jgi:hypothetical protein
MYRTITTGDTETSAIEGQGDMLVAGMMRILSSINTDIQAAAC